MTARYEEATRVFHALLAVDADKRSDHLATLDLDPELRALVAGMLAADATETGWLPLESRSPSDAVDDGSDAPLPEIEGFVIDAIAGRGGMGTVYRARQLHPSRVVAIKVLDADLATDPARVEDLLRHEVDAVTRLHHPNIALMHCLAKASFAAQERACLVMEYVPGPRITEFAESRGLTVRERVELFLQVLDGVGHANALGVVHRDLKPSNILVFEPDADSAPVVKVIDFGIAKIVRVDDDGEAAGRSLTLRNVMGAVPYVAPEQLGIGVSLDHRLDERCDVHALGIILFELLTGELPYAVADVPLGMAVQRFASESPRSLRSVRSRGDSSVRSGRAAWRDMDAILARATAKRADDRFRSVSEVGAELRRWLDGNSVRTRVEGPLERVSRFVGNNKRLSLAAAIVCLVVAGSALVSTLLYVRATRSEARAVSLADDLGVENDRLRRMDEFLIEILSSASFEQSQVTSRQPEDLRAIDLIDWVDGQIGAQFADRPESALMLRLAIAESYTSHRRVEDAEAQLVLCDALAERLDPDSLAVLELQRTRCANEIKKLVQTNYGGEFDRGVEMVEEIIAKAEELEAWPQYIASRNDLTGVLFSQVGAAAVLEHAEQTAAVAEELLGDHYESSVAVNNLGYIYQHSGDADAAVRMFERAIEIKERIGRGDRPDTFVSRANLIGAIRDRGTGEDLLPMFRDLLERRRRALPEHHMQVLDNRRIIGLLLIARGDAEEALEELEGAARVARAHEDAIGWIAPAVERELIKAYRQVGRVDEARALYDSEMAKPHLPEIFHEFMQDRAGWLMEQGELTEAEAMFRELLAQTASTDLHNTGRRLFLLGSCLREQGRVEEAVETWGRVVDAEEMPAYLRDRCRGQIEEVANKE